MSEDSGTRDLEIEHLADLANLPLEEDEEDALEGACQEVLDAFELPEAEPAPTDGADPRWLEDDAEPWPEQGIEAILDEVPRRDRREIQP